MLTNPVARTMLAISVVAFPLLEARGQALWQDTTISECGDRTHIVQYVRQVLGEEPVARGRTFEGEVVELFASPSGSWSAVITPLLGPSCFATHGDNWETLPRPVARLPKPSRPTSP